LGFIFQNKTRITDTLHKDVIACMILSRWILFRTRNILDKICEENHNTILCSITFFSKVVPFMK